MTSDEVLIDMNKSFTTALQELKNIRPQLYSAAEYCEQSYLNSEKKQMFLENLKDYALRALVNAVDHIGTVAYKLSDVLEQHTVEISSVDLKITCLNQKLLTCRTYTDREGLRQQQLLAVIPRHHKHYILPNSVKKVHFGPHMQTDSRQTTQVKGVSAAKTLSWHLASETKSRLKGSSRGIMSTDDARLNKKSSSAFNSIDDREKKKMKSTPATKVAMQTLGVRRLRDSLEGIPYKSFDDVAQKEIVLAPPARSKSVISSFFAKAKGNGNLRTS